MSRPSQMTFWRRRAVALFTLFALILLISHLVDGGGSSGGRRDSSRKSTPLRQAVVLPKNPFTSEALRAYVAGRHGEITAAVENLNTHAVYLYHPDDVEQTASVEKVDILETLLHTEQDKGPLDDNDATLATGMIENSNNDDAQALWNEVGAANGVTAYDQAAGLDHTDPDNDGYWGETTTTARDQLVLLQRLALANPVLTDVSRRYQLGLMKQVEADQRWGVSGGVPSTATIALKNGWVPLTSNTDWQVNSVGQITGEGRNYLLAVMTAHDPSEAYGIATIDGIASIVWSHLGGGR